MSAKKNRKKCPKIHYLDLTLLF